LRAWAWLLRAWALKDRKPGPRPNFGPGSGLAWLKPGLPVGGGAAGPVNAQYVLLEVVLPPIIHNEIITHHKPWQGPPEDKPEIGFMMSSNVKMISAVNKEVRMEGKGTFSLH